MGEKAETAVELLAKWRELKEKESSTYDHALFTEQMDIHRQLTNKCIDEGINIVPSNFPTFSKYNVTSQRRGKEKATHVWMPIDLLELHSLIEWRLIQEGRK